MGYLIVSSNDDEGCICVMVTSLYFIRTNQYCCNALVEGNCAEHVYVDTNLIQIFSIEIAALLSTIILEGSYFKLSPLYELPPRKS